MSEGYVLDASAVLCLLLNEPGADRVIAALPRAWISAVNLSEVYATLADAGGSEPRIAQAVGALHLRVEPFDGEQARTSGMMQPLTRGLGLSLGDRACLALARSRTATVLTTDQALADLPRTVDVGIELVC